MRLVANKYSLKMVELLWCKCCVLLWICWFLCDYFDLSTNLLNNSNLQDMHRTSSSSMQHEFFGRPDEGCNVTCDFTLRDVFVETWCSSLLGEFRYLSEKWMCSNRCVCWAKRHQKATFQGKKETPNAKNTSNICQYSHWIAIQKLDFFGALAFGHILQVCAERIRSKSLEDMTEQQPLEEDPEAMIFGAVQWDRAKRIDFFKCEIMSWCSQKIGT